LAVKGGECSSFQIPTINYRYLIMLTENQKNTILATVPILRENGVALTKHFYARLFQSHPELKNLFNLGNQASGRQQTALAMAVLAYAENIANPGVLMPAVDLIGHKHASLHIQPEQYAVVGHNLIESIKEVLGEAATPAIVEAWTVAYQQLADLMIGHEQGIYQKKHAAKNGWLGWKTFVVKSKVKESEEVTSFYLYPSDGGGVASFVPGQFVSVKVFVPELGLEQIRQYSLSSAPNGEYYRISVKRESSPSNPEGLVSNRLHDGVQAGDSVELSSPSGNFVLQQTDRKKVLISGGIGQTPLLAMLEQLAGSDKKSAEVAWIHGCRGSEVHAFQEHVAKIASENKSLSVHCFYESKQLPDSGNFYSGKLDLSQVADEVSVDNEYYLCGPAKFIELHYKKLIKSNVPASQIFYEEFGPQMAQLG
jgi:nitric oxide dioxygenase